MIQTERQVKLLIVSNCDSLASVVCSPLFLNPNFQVVCVAKTKLSFINKLRVLNRAVKVGATKYAIYMQFESFLAYLARLRNKANDEIINCANERNIYVPVVERLSEDTMTPLILNFKPDMVLSVRPGLIFKQSAIDAMPPIINLHCSRLPGHAGIGGVLQALAADDSELGVTFHAVDSEAIDSGAIVMQETIAVEKGRSVFHHTYLLYKKAAAMLSSWTPYNCDGKLRFEDLSADQSVVSSYNSWPKSSVYRNLAKNGYRLILRDDLFL